MDLHVLVTEFDYELPPELIAQVPIENRTASRLLCLDKVTGHIQHQQFSQLLDFIQPNDLLVFNDTKVMAARLQGHKVTGGGIEILIERVLEPYTCLAQVKANRALKLGARIILDANAAIYFEVLERQQSLYLLRCHSPYDILTVLANFGEIPLPPYIKRAATKTDAARYQTVYAEQLGAVAAPTAGLHFDEALLAQIKARGIDCAYLTLHVGAGTFMPVRVTDLASHQMHREHFVISQTVCEQIARARQRGGRIIAVGTTSVRALETAAQSGSLQAMQGETQLFIYPGYRFRLVDGMITNFHLPQSTLLMLVCAFAGIDTVMAAYRAAVDQSYRFFSYGDAMFIAS